MGANSWRELATSPVDSRRETNNKLTVRKSVNNIFWSVRLFAAETFNQSNLFDQLGEASNHLRWGWFRACQLSFRFAVVQNLSGGNVRHLSVTPGPERNTQGCGGWPVPFNMAFVSTKKLAPPFSVRSFKMPFVLSNTLTVRLYRSASPLVGCVSSPDVVHLFSARWHHVFPPLGWPRHDVTSYEFESTYEMTRTTPFLGVDSHDARLPGMAASINHIADQLLLLFLPNQRLFIFRREKINWCVCVCVFA